MDHVRIESEMQKPIIHGCREGMERKGVTMAVKKGLGKGLDSLMLSKEGLRKLQCLFH